MTWDAGTQSSVALGPLRYNGDGESDKVVAPTVIPKVMVAKYLLYAEFCAQNPLWATHQGGHATGAPIFYPLEALIYNEGVFSGLRTGLDAGGN